MVVTTEYFALKRKSGKVVSIIHLCMKIQRTSSVDSIPLNYNLQVELFNVWGIDYMRPFVRSQGCEYILVAVGYVSKWVEAMPCRATDAKHARKMFHEIIFLRFGTPRMVISDGGSHFIDSLPEISQGTRDKAQHRDSVSPSDQWSSRNI